MLTDWPFAAATMAGVVILVGGALALLRWLDAWAPRGGLGRTFAGFLLVNLAVVLPEMVVLGASLWLGHQRMAEVAPAASALWRFGACGLLAIVLPPARNPLLPGRNLATLMPAVVVVAAVLTHVGTIVRLSRRNDPTWAAASIAIVLLPYLGCLWLVWRSGLEGKDKPPGDLDADLIGDAQGRPRIAWAIVAVLAIGAGGMIATWALNGELRMRSMAFGSSVAMPGAQRRVLLILGAALALPGIIQAWLDRRRLATRLRPTRELLACATLLVLPQLMGVGVLSNSDPTAPLAMFGLLAGGAIVVLLASVERLIPVPVRGVVMTLAAIAPLALAWSTN